LAGAGYARFHSENAWLLAAAAALLLLGAFWITVLHHRTSAGAMVFLASAAMVSVASAEWPPVVISIALGLATIVVMFKKRKGAT
jgi:hypothetical protein